MRESRATQGEGHLAEQGTSGAVLLVRFVRTREGPDEGHRPVWEGREHSPNLLTSQSPVVAQDIVSNF